MWWRLSPKEFSNGKGDGNRKTPRTLLDVAVAFAKKRGAKAVEGYPADPHPPAAPAGKPGLKSRQSPKSLKSLKSPKSKTAAPASGALADAFLFTGLVPAFRKAGFDEVARRSPTRPIMRRGTSRRSANR